MSRSNSGIEVLRCWSMFLIVLMHCATFVPTGDGYKARLVHVFCMFAVNAFALISGWFGINYSLRKVGKLLGLGLFSAIVLMLLSPLAGTGWHFRYSLGWFGNAYLALLCVSPILNAAIESLRRQSEEKFRMVWLVYAVLMIWSWLPVDFLGVDVHVPGWQAHSFNQLCFMYVTGQVLSRYEPILRIRQRWLALGAIVLMAANYSWAIAAGLTRGNTVLQQVLVGTRGYNNPMIIILSVCVFALCYRCQFPSWLSRVCLFMAPSMFSVYLLHEATNHDLSVQLYVKYLSLLPGGDGARQYVAIFAVAALVFFVCLSIDLLRRAAGVALSKVTADRCK